MIKIYLDPGHGGVDPGAVDHGLREKDITLEVSKKIRAYLNKHYKGFTVRMSRTTDKTMSLAQRVNDANSWGADYFLSVHVNAGGGTGYEDFIYNGNVSNKTVSNRNTIHNAITGMPTGVRNRGKKRANFYVLRNTRMPAALTENMFIDTKADADKLKSDSFLNDIAEGHAEGLASALDLKKKGNTSSKPKAKPKAKTTSKPKSTSKGNQTTTSIVDYLKSINVNSGFANRKRLAKQYGIKNYTGTASQNDELLRKMRGGSTPSKPKQSTSLKVGNTVTLKSSATHFATGESILNSVKGKKYKIIQVKSDRVLLDKIMSWVKKSDVQ